jgi:rare lipoprotein A
VVQYPDIAVASSESSDVPLWKKLLSAFTPAPRPAHRHKERPLRAAATRNSLERLAESPVREPPNAAEPVAESQAREPPNPAEPVVGSQVRAQLSAAEPVTGPPVRAPLHPAEAVAGWQVRAPLNFPEPGVESQVREPSSSPEPVVGSLLREPPKSNRTDCNGGKRIISAFYWQGQRTASGQHFDPQGMTAAHRTLPFGTRLTVTNPRTGKSVTVVVNDRGPFVSGVSLDLSLGAAQAIGMHGTGAVCIW